MTQLENTARRPTATFADRATWSHLGPLIGSTAVPFLLVVYLAMRGGGYDAVVRSEVGVAVWWVVLLGAVAGILPLTRLTRATWVVGGLIAAFGAWTALSLLWTESSERTVVETARVLTYLGIFAAAVSVQGREAVRRTVYAVAAAAALVGVLALLSRLHPQWFPDNETADVLTYAKARLNYPLNYWNGLAYLIAIGMPLLLVVATSARRTLTRVVAAAVVPALALASFYTLSRGGAVALLAGLGCLLLLHPRRLALLPVASVITVGSALLIAAATQRDALENGGSGPIALRQGDEMLAIAIAVVAATALLTAAIALMDRYRVGPRLRASRGTSFAVTGSVAVVLVACALALGLPGEVGDQWEEFKAPVGPQAGDTTGRFESASGNGRYQWWESAVDAAGTQPLTGIGSGTFEFWWAREGNLPGFVRDAHSLYLETLGELGVPGLLLIVGLVLAVLLLGAGGALRGNPDDRPWLAAATAGCFAFATGSAVDWTWELAVLPAMFLCLAAAIAQARPSTTVAAGADDLRPRTWAARAATGVVAVFALLAIGVPLAGSRAVDASREAVDASQLDSAAQRADTAADLQPWAATPPLQRALVLELRGELGSAAEAAREAAAQEPTNWRPWFILSRIEETRGDASASQRAYEEAKSLNPRSALFAE